MTPNAAPPVPPRVLVVDDNPSILEDFRKILVPGEVSAELTALEAAVFGDTRPAASEALVELSFASQGAEAVTVVERAAAAGWSFDVAFVDVRMPPGYDGVETVLRLWRIDPRVQVVLCTAYSDYEWEDMVDRLGAGDGYLVLKKPFDGIEVRQLVHSLREKRALLVEREARLAELDRLVLERTAALAETNARLAVEMAQRLAAEQQLHQTRKLEELGRLAAFMGHEINNPLSYVEANVEGAAGRLATGDPLDPAERVELCTMLDETVAGVQRISSLVRHLKVFSRAQPDPARQFALNDVVDSALVLVGDEIRTRATLRCELAEGLAAVTGEPGRIEQVLVNLLINAVQSIPPGNPAGNTIGIATRAGGPGEVLIEISDTGVGIEARDLERVFEAFYTTKPVGEGTGLGLAICRSIVEAHGGRIRIDSAVGSGTTVGLSLRT